jgi:hypothetical protein
MYKVSHLFHGYDEKQSPSIRVDYSQESKEPIWLPPKDDFHFLPMMKRL